MREDTRGQKAYLDAAALAIVAKWRARYAKGWDATHSDVIRIMDSMLEEHDRREREALAASTRGRRLGVGP